MDDETTTRTDTNQSVLLKELSDIKASLAVNTSETANIKGSITEIKSDIREIKADFVSRREFNDGLASVRAEIALPKKLVYGMVAVILLAVIGAIVQLVLIN
jgi:hypothetical protein